MELRAILKIFKDNAKLFLSIWASFVLIGAMFFVFQADRYKVNLMLNVTRIGSQSTTDYRYDDFYRLQADERFADTVVRWLGAPQIVQEILQEAGIALEIPLQAHRLSSQMIEVIFLLPSENNAQAIAAAISRTLNRQTEKLNAQQKNENWFMLIADKPHVASSKIGLEKIFWVAFLLGLFFGAWGVMIANYLKR